MQLQESQGGLGTRLTQQRHQLIDLFGSSYSIDSDVVRVQDTKEKVDKACCVDLLVGCMCQISLPSLLKLLR